MRAAEHWGTPLALFPAGTDLRERLEPIIQLKFPSWLAVESYGDWLTKFSMYGRAEQARTGKADVWIWGVEKGGLRTCQPGPTSAMAVTPVPVVVVGCGQ